MRRCNIASGHVIELWGIRAHEVRAWYSPALARSRLPTPDRRFTLNSSEEGAGTAAGFAQRTVLSTDNCLRVSRSQLIGWADR
jgi:hypothetical protein